ncbi:MAG: LysR family transcriptional regulator [Oscillospiraceae bacterium]|nr:LysR family transcriptional regulator [Oscillospiraceae bacterium]
MKLARIEAFCAVARNMSFSKAAEECHVAQSAISQQIKALEEDLGFPLFVRSTRKVTFTDAGQSFYVDCVKLMSGFDDAVDRATSTLRRKKHVLTVGIEGLMQCTTKSDIIRRFAEKNPDVDILYRQVGRDDKYEDLISGKIDVVFDIPQYFTLNNRIKKCGVIKNEHCVMVHREHPLASCDKVSVRELSEHVTFWGGIPIVEDYVVKSYREYFRQSDIEPKNIICVPEQDIATFMVSTGAGGNIVPVSEKKLWNSEVYAFVELEKPLVLESAWLYSVDNKNPALTSFVEEIDR